MNCYPKSRVVSMVALLLFSTTSLAAAQGEKKTIYLALWRGCEQACEGFRDEIAASSIDAKVVVRNADRDKGKLAGFVEEARALKSDMVVTWGTSVTLGMAGTITEQQTPKILHDLPVVFMIVADPIGSGIIESYEKTGRANLTGTRNRVPEKVNVATMQAYLPSFSKLGLLFNRDEPNSVLKMKELQELSGEMGFELIAREVELDADGKPMADSIPVQLAEIKAAGADFAYFGSSSFLQVHGDLFTRAMVDNDLPLLSPYEKLVRDSDALLSVAAPYSEVGRLAARQVLKILVDGIPPGELPVASLDQFTYVINMATAKKLKLFPPIDFLQFAETVN